MPALDLHYVNELVAAREAQHGGRVGAPVVVGGYREGASINRSCVVMISALLQGFVDDVFLECAKVVTPALADPTRLALYRKGVGNWGNPNPQNIDKLFLRFGVDKILDGLSWRNCNERTVRTKLDHLNQIRNGIAHGQADLKVNGQDISLNLMMVKSYRDFARSFGERFESHATGKM